VPADAGVDVDVDVDVDVAVEREQERALRITSCRALTGRPPKDLARADAKLERSRQ
jgi:hypothetical protein